MAKISPNVMSRSHGGDHSTSMVDRREGSLARSPTNLVARSPTAITGPQPASDAVLKKAQVDFPSFLLISCT